MAILFGTESIRYRMEKTIVNPQRQFSRRKLATPRTQLDRSQWIEGAIDLMEQILASLVLELPYAPLHAEDCPGICPQCGADLAEGPCDCRPGGSDSPFAVLKDLLPPDPEA